MWLLSVGTICVVGVWLCACAPTISDGDVITVVSYNVRGTFGNTVEQEGKAAQIALALQYHNLERGDIILLQEVDNRDIVQQLVEEHLVLSPLRYAVVAPARASPITQAVVSAYPIIEARMHTVSHDDVRRTRGFLEVVVGIGDRRLVIYNLHLKSRRGGVQETEPQRAAVMRALRQRIAMRLAVRADAEIIVAGDMNSDVRIVDEDSGPIAFVAYGTDIDPRDGLHIAQLNQLPALAAADDALVFVSPWQDADWPGSHHYQQQWWQLDHFFLSQSLFDDRGFEYDDFYVAVDEESAESVIDPHGAASDHLPIVLTVVLR